MRILFHHRIASRDGQSVHLEELIAAFRRQGHEIILVGPSAFVKTKFGGSNLAVDRVKHLIPRLLYELLELAYNVRAFLRLRAAVRTFRPDVIYERFSLFLFAGMWIHRIYGLPILLEVNSPLYEEQSENDGLRLRRLARLAQRSLWNAADHVLPVTRVLARTAAAYGVVPSRITVIPNGIDPERFADVPDIVSAKKNLLLTGRLVIGFTGFIRSWNALHRLIDFVALHGARFALHIVIVGDGPIRPSLEEAALQRGVRDRLTITGVVERDDVARHIAAFDIAVIPGVTPYASPLKLFEYLELGRAIVAPDVENIREILTEGENALLFDPVSDEALADALLRLCEDPALRARLGDAARRTIAAKSLTWNHNAECIVAVAKTLTQPTAHRDR
jgi:glycosyltransferase involved in cell wall biosynthesis